MMNRMRKDNSLTKIFMLFVCVIAAVFLCPISAQAKEEKVVRVGYYETAGFQEYNAETDEYSGYSYEFLMALGQYANWTYEFVPCSFAEGLTMLENGQIDLMNNVSKTEQREQIFEFSTLSSGENIAYLAMKQGDTRVALDDLKAIETIQIGLAEDSIYSSQLVTYFEDNGVSANIKWYLNREQVVEAFEGGVVDAYILTSSTKADEHIILSFAPDTYYLATTKGNTDLIRDLDVAITALRANDPYFEPNLQEKYYSQTAENYTILTEDETDYLAEHPVARVLYQPNWYPLSYQDENGEFAGAIRGVYDLLEKRTGLRFEYVAPEDEAESGDVMGQYQVQILAEQPTDFCGANLYQVKLTKSFVSTPLMEMANHILVPGDTIALVEGDYLSEVCQRIYGENYQYSYCDSVEACVQQVRNKEADGTVLISYESEFYRQQRKYSSLTYTIVDDGSYSLSIAVSQKADPRLYSIIQKGLNSISSGELSNVFNNTLISLQKEDLISVLYNNPLPMLLMLAGVAALIAGLIVGQIFIQKLRRQNEIINEKNAALQTANQATTNFFSRMSHDMRTPMNGILGMARLSADETDSAVLRQNIAKIENSGEYLLSLINDTLDFQRIESGKLQLKPEIVCCNDIMESVVDMICPAAEKKHIQFQIANRNLALNEFIMVDPVRIKQIFLNLLSNAVKFTPEGGTVSMEYECIKQEGCISYDRFCVRDTGIGMSEEFIRNRMFQPFSQEQNEVTGQYAGSGLGLSIVKSLVELMGGTIQVQSELGAGTTFIIDLNVEQVSKERVDNAADNRAKQHNDVVQDLHGKRVLLAEDHPLNAEIASKLLQKAGCEVTWVKNGQECVDTFCKGEMNCFDLILMDIRMPIMNGLEAAQAVRSLKRTDAAEIPIVAMTANAYEDDIRKSLDAGMNAHLAKPIDPVDLYHTITKVIKESCMRR